MITQEKSKKIIDVHFNEAVNQYERILFSRSEYRNRTITVFTILVGILGFIVVFQNSDKTFFELWDASKLVIKIGYSLFTLTGLLLFFITFLYTKSYTLSNVHDTLVANSQELLNSGSQEVAIELAEEKLIVDEEYYVRVEFIKSYSIATQKIIDDLKFMRFVYIFGFVSFVFSFLISIFIIFL